MAFLLLHNYTDFIAISVSLLKLFSSSSVYTFAMDAVLLYLMFLL